MLQQLYYIPELGGSTLEMASEMAKECRCLADELHAEAQALEIGKNRHFTDGVDDSPSHAIKLRHRARNIEAVLTALQRLSVREELKAITDVADSRAAASTTAN